MISIHNLGCSDWWIFVYNSNAGADPGFYIGGDPNPPGGGANLRFYQKIPKNCMKLRKVWVVGAVGGMGGTVVTT